MRIFIFLITIVCVFGCSSSKDLSNKLGVKTYKNEFVRFNYPNSWTHFPAHGYENFCNKKVSYKGYNRYNLINITSLKKLKNKNQYTFKKFVEESLKSKSYYDKIEVTQETTRFGLTFIVSAEKYKTKIIKGGSKVLYKYFQKNGDFYLFHYSSSTPIYDKYLKESLMIFETAEIL